MPVLLEKATGVTRDISASGVFFWLSGTHVVEGSISFSIEFQRLDGKFMLKCQGDIVRTEWRDDALGVAVRFTKTTMEPVQR